jgi:DeoR/GlpR family transcriptional regulator of sugar metabolism
MDTTMAEVPIKRGMIAASGQRVLVVDAAKFATGGKFRVCGIEDLDTVVTDAGDDEPLLEALQDVDVQVLRA